MRAAIWMLWCAAGSVFAQPFIVPNGVVNAASYASPGLPGGSIARGSFFSIFGRQFGPAQYVQASSFPLQPNLAGVSIKVMQGNTSVDALPVFVAATQINAILPSNAPLGQVTIQVTYNNVKSNPLPVQVVNTSVGIFAANSGGNGPGILQNYIAADQQPINSPAGPARPGQVITLWGTGLGPVPADNVAPTPGDLSVPVEVYVGGKLSKRLYSGRSPCCAGTDQIVFEVPQDTPVGCYVPVYVRAGGVTSNVVTMAIQQEGAAGCTDPLPVMQTLRQGGKVGIVAMIRTDGKRKNPTTTNLSVTDWALVTMRDQAANPFAFHPYLALPPPDSCTAFSVSGNLLGGDNPVGALFAGKQLNYGSTLSMIGPGVSKQIPASGSADLSFYAIGGKDADLNLNRPALEAGNYTLTAAGGSDVSGFRADFSMPALLNWANRDSTLKVDRTKALALNWTGAPAGQSVIVFGASADLPTNSSAMFVCVAPAGASSFSVPPAILSVLPRARTSLAQTRGMLNLGTVPNSPASFNAPGLAAGTIIPVLLTGRAAIFF